MYLTSIEEIVVKNTHIVSICRYVVFSVKFQTVFGVKFKVKFMNTTSIIRCYERDSNKRTKMFWPFNVTIVELTHFPDYYNKTK